MAKITELEQPAWDVWVASRPPCVQALCAALPPNLLYRLKSTGHRVTIYSYSEDGTVTVVVSGKYNAVTFGRRVFGITPDQLEECELPDPDEPLGELLTERADVDALIGVQIAAMHRKGLKHNQEACPLCR